MKKVLIVHAHPEANSFCSALKDQMKEFYQLNGAEVRISDLYKMNFNPVGGTSDFSSLKNSDYFKYQAEQVSASERNEFSDDIQKELENLFWCDTLVFSFPLWWFGLPAILKGWVDRVFAMGKVYGNGIGVYENGIFKDKNAFVSITTGGPTQAYGPNGKNGEMETILFPIHHGMFYFTGMTVLEPFISFSPARMDDDQRKGEIERLKDFLGKERNILYSAI